MSTMPSHWVPGDVAHSLFVFGVFWREFQRDDVTESFAPVVSADDVANAATCLQALACYISGEWSLSDQDLDLVVRELIAGDSVPKKEARSPALSQFFEREGQDEFKLQGALERCIRYLRLLEEERKLKEHRLSLNGAFASNGRHRWDADLASWDDW